MIPTSDVPCGQSPMELLTTREMSQTIEARLLATTGRVTITDPSDTLGDLVVEQTVRKLIETSGRLVANRNAPGSGVTAPYETIDDTGRVQLSQDVMTREGVSNATSSTRSSKVPDRKIREMPAKKVSRVIDVQKNNQLKYSFRGVPDTDPRACFNRSTWSPAVNMQQPPLGTSHLILGDRLVRVLQNLRTSWITTVIAFGAATIAQLFRMVELMNPGRILNVMILVGTNNISRSSDEEEAQWESMMVCLLTREMSQTIETRLLATTGRVTITDPSDTLGDLVVEQTVRKLIETSGRLVANRKAPGSGVTAPYGTIDDTGRVQLSQDVMTREGVSNATSSTRSSRVPDRKIREMPAKKVSRVIDVQKNNQLKYSFRGVPDTDTRACFNRSTWSPAVNMQQPPLGTSHLILGDRLVRVLQNLRTSWITTVITFGAATIAHLFRMVELMNPGRILNVMILVGTNNISRSSDEEEAQWESMMVCLFTTVWQRFNCAVLTFCTVPMSTKTLTATGRRHNEAAIRWNNILRNLASRNA